MYFLFDSTRNTESISTSTAFTVNNQKTNMRIAILVLGIVGSVIAFSVAACVGACAGCIATVEGGGEATTLVGSVALSVGLQGVLGLTGCIMSFISLGNGSKSYVGGILLTIAVLASIWAVITINATGVATVLHLIAAILAFIAPSKLDEEE